MEDVKRVAAITQFEDLERWGKSRMTSWPKPSRHEGGEALWGSEGGLLGAVKWEGAKPRPSLSCPKKTFWNRAQLNSQSIFHLKKSAVVEIGAGGFDETPFSHAH
jgi:hypothetical protein